MSLYSGKCDFCDMCDIHNVDNILKSNVYIGWNIIPLKFETKKDLIPYYPYLVSLSATTNGVGEIRLSTESYVDRSERESLELYTKECQRYVNKCKRKKEFCDISHFNKENDYGYNEIYEEIISRLMMIGFEKIFPDFLKGICQSKANNIPENSPVQRKQNANCIVPANGERSGFWWQKV